MRAGHRTFAPGAYLVVSVLTIFRPAAERRPWLEVGAELVVAVGRFGIREDIYVFDSQGELTLSRVCAALREQVRGEVLGGGARRLYQAE